MKKGKLQVKNQEQKRVWNWQNAASDPVMCHCNKNAAVHDFPPIRFFWLDTTNWIYRSLHLIRAWLKNFRILWKQQNTIITFISPSYRNSPGRDTTYTNTNDSHLENSWVVYSTETSIRMRVEKKSHQIDPCRNSTNYQKTKLLLFSEPKA